MSPAFRLAETSDLPTLITLVKEFYHFQQVKLAEEVSKSVLIDIIQNESIGKVWLVENEKEAIAYMILTFGYSLEYQGKYGLIDEIYLREKYRGQGIGTQAIKLAQETCKNLGIKTTHLEVDNDNSNAQQLYKKFGYKKTNRSFWVNWI